MPPPCQAGLVSRSTDHTVQTTAEPPQRTWSPGSRLVTSPSRATWATPTTSRAGGAGWAFWSADTDSYSWHSPLRPRRWLVASTSGGTAMGGGLGGARRKASRIWADELATALPAPAPRAASSGTTSTVPLRSDATGAVTAGDAPVPPTAACAWSSLALVAPMSAPATWTGRPPRSVTKRTQNASTQAVRSAWCQRSSPPATQATTARPLAAAYDPATRSSVSSPALSVWNRLGRNVRALSICQTGGAKNNRLAWRRASRWWRHSVLAGRGRRGSIFFK